jgi:hypothetical protein
VWRSNMCGREVLGQRRQRGRLWIGAIGATFKARAHDTVAARQRVPRRVVPSGDGVLTRGLRRGKKETDKWDPGGRKFPD